jgi:Zn-dependent protease
VENPASTSFEVNSPSPRSIQYIEIAHETEFSNAFAGFVLNMPTGSAMIAFCMVRVMLGSRVATFISVLPIFLVSLTVHEYAHGWMACRYGDDTAKRMGRLTLNPLAHISLFGTIILPLVAHFGWARPVPVNFSVLTRSQLFKVAAAGPLANISLAVILAGLFHLLHLQAIPILANFLLLAILFNLVLAVFNLLPIPPLDGSRMVYARLKSPQAIRAYNRFAQYSLFILIAGSSKNTGTNTQLSCLIDIIDKTRPGYSLAFESSSRPGPFFMRTKSLRPQL